MFDQSTIMSVSRPMSSRGQLYLSWTSPSPTGTWYQIYVNRKLLWKGKNQSAVIPVPASLARIDIGTVGYGEATTDFSASLPSAPLNRVQLNWTGGTFLSALGDGDVAGFKVFGGSATAGFGTGGFGYGAFGTGESSVSYTTPLAIIPAYTGNTITDGFGYGTFGGGSFGFASATYSWSSGALAGGLWTFAVAPYDSEGNLGTVTTIDTTIIAAPAPPAAFTNGTRLEYALDGFGFGPFGGDGFGSLPFGSLGFGGGVSFGGSAITLNWNPSA